jgi:hypothetical protein
MIAGVANGYSLVDRPRDSASGDSVGVSAPFFEWTCCPKTSKARRTGAGHGRIAILGGIMPDFPHWRELLITVTLRSRPRSLAISHSIKCAFPYPQATLLGCLQENQSSLYLRLNPSFFILDCSGSRQS